MTEQSNNSAGGPPPANGNNNNPNRNRNRRRNNNRPRDPNAPVQTQGQGQPRPQNPNQNRPHNPNQPRPQGQHPNQQQGPGQKRRHPQHNKPRPQGEARPPQPQGSGGPLNIERIYEKYLNLLDQHIIARRKYHDLFYRADPAQKNKLERNFYNTLNDIREFESKLAPDVMTLFEKRNNGYQYDRIYTTNHEIPVEGDVVPDDLPPAEPHLLRSQIAADYSGDVEESVGTAEDYLKYKGF
jgi:hypothetical protein